jgi:hypothetical protein
VTQHDLVRTSVAEETMAELRAVTEELQALRPSVTPLCERAYRVFQSLVDETEQQPFPATVEVGLWDVLRQNPEIAAFRTAADDLARDFAAAAGGHPSGDPDWLQAAEPASVVGDGVAHDPSA